MHAITETERKEASRKETGLPRTFFLASVFHGNEILLQQAIDDGEVQVKVDNGKEFCSYKWIKQTKILRNERFVATKRNKIG